MLLVRVFLGISVWFFCFLQGLGLFAKLQKVYILKSQHPSIFAMYTSL